MACSKSFIANCVTTAARLAASSHWPAEDFAMLKRQILRCGSDLRKLNKAAKKGAKFQATNLRSRILLGFPGNACGLLCEIERQELKGGTLQPMSWQNFDDATNQLPSRSGEPDLVNAHFKKKASGGSRLICNPGARTRASHALICQVLDASDVTSPDEYNLKGRGNKAAIEMVRQLILQGDLTYLVTFDIKKFFPSVRPKHLGWLKMPPRIVEKCLFFLDDHSPNVHDAQGGKTKMARHGLPQGAPGSAKIASALLGRELRNLGGEMGKVTYVDDGVIGACSQVDAEKVAKALKKRLADLHGGPIGLGKLEVASVEQGFEFLGYWIRLSTVDGEHKVVCKPSHSAKMKAQRRLFGRLRHAGKSLTYDQAIEIAHNYIGKWINSFVHWKPTPSQIDELMFEAECWVSDFFSGWVSKKPPVNSD